MSTVLEGGIWKVEVGGGKRLLFFLPYSLFPILVFLEQKGLEMDTIGAFFHKMSQNAVKISSIHDFRENEIEMIYIED